MENNMFDKWDATIDTEGLQKDIAEASNNSGNYKEVPHGNYEVRIDKMELRKSKKDSPMVSIWFNIINGEYKGSRLFYNQVIVKGFQLRMVNEMLSKIVSGLGNRKPIIEFKTYNQYNELLMDIFEKISGKFEYGISYTANKKNPQFSDFDVIDVFSLVDDEDTPF